MERVTNSDAAYELQYAATRGPAATLPHNPAGAQGLRSLPSMSRVPEFEFGGVAKLAVLLKQGSEPLLSSTWNEAVRCSVLCNATTLAVHGTTVQSGIRQVQSVTYH